jgi:hypothetical protein
LKRDNRSVLSEFGFLAWSDRALSACAERLRTSTVTSAHEVGVVSAWTDGPDAFCIVYRNPYFDGLIGLRRDSADAYAAIAKEPWRRGQMTSGYDMGDAGVLNGQLPDPFWFGWNVADFDIGEPHVPQPEDLIDARGVHWHGNLTTGTPTRP